LLNFYTFLITRVVIPGFIMFYAFDYFNIPKSASIKDRIIFVVAILPFIGILRLIYNDFIRSEDQMKKEKRLSKTAKIVLFTLLTFFLSKRLRQKVYTIIREVRDVFSNK
jgi:hypothetical protein